MLVVAAGRCSTTIPSSIPSASISRSASSSRSSTARSAPSAGRPASSLISRPSPEVIVELGADRRRALRHARQQLDAVEAHADGAARRRRARRGTAPPGRAACARSRCRRGPARRASARQLGEHRVGRETSTDRAAGSRRRRPAGRARRRSRRRPRPRSTSAWNVDTMPFSNAAAHTATAVPPSISRPSPTTPPAPQPISTSGCERVVDALERRLGRREVRAARRRRRRGRCCCRRARRRPWRPPRRRPPADPMRSTAHTRCARSSSFGRYSPAVVAHTGCVAPASARALRPDRRRQDRRRDRARRADPRARRAAGGGLGRRAAGLRGPGDPHRRAGRARSARGSSTASISFLPVDARFSVAEYAALAHAEIDGLLAEGATPIVVGGTGLYLRAALAELAAAPAAAGGVRERWRPSCARAGRRRCTPSSRARRRGRPRRSTRATATGSCARSSCSTQGVLEPPAQAQPAVDARHAPPDAARRPRPRPRRALRAHRARASTRWSPPARGRGPPRGRRRRLADRARRARLRASCWPATSRR